MRFVDENYIFVEKCVNTLAAGNISPLLEPVDISKDPNLTVLPLLPCSYCRFCSDVIFLLVTR